MEFRKNSLENMEINPDFWKDKRVLLTGHTGFKGSWLSLWFQKLGINLIGYSKSIPTVPSLFELADIQNGMTSILGDICDLNNIENVIRDHEPEIIIHMAAQSLVSKSYQNPIETYATNVMGTANLLEAVRRVGKVRVMINVTSDKCYGEQKLSRGYHEEDPMGGYDPYSSSKGCAELVTSSFRNSFFNPDDYQKHGLAIASVRAGNVIGGGDWAMDRLIPDLLRGIIEGNIVKIRNPYSIRPWQFVLDPLKGYLLLTEKLWIHGPEYVGAWNFGPDNNDLKPVSWIVEQLSKKWNNLRCELTNNHIHESYSLKLDSTKAKTKLGWTTKMNLDLTLEWIMEWYEQYIEKNDMRQFTEKQIKQFTLL